MTYFASNDPAFPDAIRKLVGDDAEHPLIANIISGPTFIAIDELRAGVAHDDVLAAEAVELRACLRIAYDSLPDHSAGAYAERFDTALALSAAEGFVLTPGLACAFSELLLLGLRGDGVEDERSRERLETALAQLS